MRTSFMAVGILALGVVVGGCRGEVGPSSDAYQFEDLNDVNAFVRGLGHLGVAESQPKTPVGCDASQQKCPADGQEGQQFCSYTHYSQTEQLDRFVALQPNSATLWPGAVVQGEDAEHGVLTPIAAPLAPVVFSVSLENIAGNPVGVMPHPSLSSFRQERNRILSSDVTGATAASIDFDVTEVYSESQLSLALGAHVSWPGGGSIAGSFDFDSSEKKTKIVVNFTQAYYTIDVDTKTAPRDFFQQHVTVPELRRDMGPGNPPVYVQSITYGRRVIFSIETDESAESMAAALAATYAGAVSAGVEISGSYQKMLQEARIQAFVLGGSAVDATGLIDGFEGLLDYIRQGGDYSKDSPGAPIGYKLAYLDNAVTKLAFTTEYADRKCFKNRATLRAELTGFDHVGGGDSGGNVEVYGTVEVRVPRGHNPVQSCAAGGDLVAVWKLEDNQYVTLPKQSSWTPPSPTFVTIPDVALGPDQQLCLTTRMVESDWPAWDDELGEDARLIGFSTGWEGEHILQARGGGDSGMDVHVKLSLE